MRPSLSVALRSAYWWLPESSSPARNQAPEGWAFLRECSPFLFVLRFLYTKFMGEIKWGQIPAKAFNLKVEYAPLSGIYKVTSEEANGVHPLFATGKSLAAALRDLANRFEINGSHGSNEEQLADQLVTPDALCKFCSAPILFAALPPPSHKYLAFDAEPVRAEDVLGVRVAGFGSRMNGRHKTVVWAGPRTTGTAWIPHPEVCGQTLKEPLSGPLKARWLERRKQFQISPEEKESVIAGLKDIVKDVDEGIIHAGFE